MEDSSLTDTQSRANLFQQGVLLNLEYWQAWLADKATDVALLDQERNGLVRGISFALDLGRIAWPSVYPVILTFSPYMERRGHWDIWNRVLHRAVAMARQLGDVANELALSLLFARLWQRQSRPKETISFYRRAIRLARCLGDAVSEARACSNLGYLYTEQGQWQRAEILCCHALAIFERWQSDHGRAHTENHLGLLYTRLEQWDKARQHLERACAIWQAMDDRHGVMRGFINLSLLSLEMGDPAETLAYATRALHQAQLTGEEAELGRIYGNMGLAYQAQGDLDQAEQYSRQAETIFQRLFNMPGLVRTLGVLGTIYLERQQWPQAIDYLEQAVQMGRAHNFRHDEIQDLIYLAECAWQRGNQLQAVVWLDEVEQQLDRDAQARKHMHLQRQVTELRRSLTEVAMSQPATD